VNPPVVEDMGDVHDLIGTDVLKGSEHKVPILTALVPHPKSTDTINKIGSDH
jgi:hypothetical protein